MTGADRQSGVELEIGDPATRPTDQQLRADADFVVGFDRPVPLDAVGAIFRGLGLTYPDARIFTTDGYGGPAFGVKLGRREPELTELEDDDG